MKEKKHKIIISKEAGYCMGVNRAFTNTFLLIKKNKNICIYAQTVHQKFALKSLENKGIKQIDALKEIINNPKIKNIIIRAHGGSPKEEIMLIKKNKTIFDFTCPKVKQVQMLAKKLSNPLDWLNHYGLTEILFGD